MVASLFCPALNFYFKAMASSVRGFILYLLCATASGALSRGPLKVFLHRLANGIGCTVVAVAFTMVPALGVAKPLPHSFLGTGQYVSYAIVFLTAFFAGFLANPQAVSSWLRPRTLGQWNERLGYLTYGSLYLTSALLCMRMNLAKIGHYDVTYGADYIGWILSTIGAYLFVVGLAAPQKIKKIAYPHYLGVIFLASGLALSHLTWFPLLALPGILVFMSWHIQNIERLQEPQPEGVSTARFRIVPFVY